METEPNEPKRPPGRPSKASAVEQAILSGGERIVYEVADLAECSVPTARWHLQRLIREGHVVKRETWQDTRKGHRRVILYRMVGVEPEDSANE